MAKRPPVRARPGGGREALSSNSTVWVMLGFDTRTFEWYIPTPGVFTTEGDADEFIRRFSKDGIVYASRKTLVGSFTRSQKRRR